MRTAIRATAIVTSMFPSNVRDRLYEDMEQNEKEREDHRNLKTYLRDSDGSNLDVTGTRSTPLADLFPETTLLVSKCEYQNMLLNLSSETNWNRCFFRMCSVCRYCGLYSMELRA